MTAVQSLPRRVEWERRTLADLGKWRGGMTPSMAVPAFWDNGSIPWISSGDVKQPLLRTTGKRVTDLAIKMKACPLIPKGSVITVVRSGILRKHFPVALNLVPMAINQDIKALVPNGNVDPEFCLHLLTYLGPEILKSALKSGTTVESVEFGWLKSYEVGLPGLVEQQLIAETLRDVDALIEAQERLIAKKRDVKQAAMQQLLTGKTRLHGFAEEWAEKPLSELFDFAGGFTASRDQLSPDLGICYLHYGDIHSSSKPYIDVSAEFAKIPKLEIDLKRIGSGALLRDGDVVFVDASEDDDGTSKHVVVRNKANLSFISGLHTIVAKRKTDELDKAFLAFCFQTSAIQQQFKFFAVGTKVKGVNKTTIKSIKLLFPAIKEQVEIAKILSDMDFEIEQLTARLIKTRDIKQGMMQQLLTGKVRLV